MTDLEKLRALMEAHSIINARQQMGLITIKALDSIEDLITEVLDTIVTTQGETTEPEAEITDDEVIEESETENE